MSLNVLTLPNTELVSSKINITDGNTTTFITPTNVVTNNVSAFSINEVQYEPAVNYIDALGNSSGNIHMTSHSLDFDHGGYIAHLNASELEVDNVNLQKINGNSFVPAVNYIDAGGIASGSVTLPTDSILNCNNFKSTPLNSKIKFDTGIGDFQIVCGEMDLRPSTTFKLNNQPGVEGQVFTSTGLNGGAPIWTTPSAGYIDSSGNASGNIHMTSHTLDFVDGNYTASFSAGDLTVDNVNLTKINDQAFVPAVNYISSSGVASGDIDMTTHGVIFHDDQFNASNVYVGGLNAGGLGGNSTQVYLGSQMGAINEPPGVVVNAGLIASSSSNQAGLYADYNFVDGSYNDIYIGFNNSSIPTIGADFYAQGEPTARTAINFASPLNLVGSDSTAVKLSSVAGNLSLDKMATSPAGNYTIQGYLPINLLGAVYYLPLFQPTLGGPSSGPIGIHQGVPQIP
jgi:hypothetical protein